MLTVRLPYSLHMRSIKAAFKPSKNLTLITWKLKYKVDLSGQASTRGSKPIQSLISSSSQSSTSLVYSGPASILQGK